ncbi:hypothetical protein K474DRAFT_1705917 [Panus rudis PR-1116 ss-1]|nr:hypothetical protein K474DRAFT_1705917 [Panus rudis PR-1116 ss-1]
MHWMHSIRQKKDKHKSPASLPTDPSSIDTRPPTSTPTPTNRLPPELTDRIIDHLHDDQVALGKAALASREWLPAIRYHRFRQVVLEGRDRVRAFWRLMDGVRGGDVGNCVESLEIYARDPVDKPRVHDTGSWDEDKGVEEGECAEHGRLNICVFHLSWLLSRLPKLNVLTLDGLIHTYHCGSDCASSGIPEIPSTQHDHRNRHDHHHHHRERERQKEVEIQKDFTLYTLNITNIHPERHRSVRPVLGLFRSLFLLSLRGCPNSSYVGIANPLSRLNLVEPNASSTPTLLSSHSTRSHSRSRSHTPTQAHSGTPGNSSVYVPLSSRPHTPTQARTNSRPTTPAPSSHSLSRPQTPTSHSRPASRPASRPPSRPPTPSSRPPTPLLPKSFQHLWLKTLLVHGASVALAYWPAIKAGVRGSWESVDVWYVDLDGQGGSGYAKKVNRRGRYTGGEGGEVVEGTADGVEQAAECVRETEERDGEGRSASGEVKRVRFGDEAGGELDWDDGTGIEPGLEPDDVGEAANEDDMYSYNETETEVETETEEQEESEPRLCGYFFLEAGEVITEASFVVRAQGDGLVRNLSQCRNLQSLTLAVPIYPSSIPSLSSLNPSLGRATTELISSLAPSTSSSLSLLTLSFVVKYRDTSPKVPVEELQIDWEKVREKLEGMDELKTVLVKLSLPINATRVDEYREYIEDKLSKGMGKKGKGKVKGKVKVVCEEDTYPAWAKGSIVWGEANGES